MQIQRVGKGKVTNQPRQGRIPAPKSNLMQAYEHSPVPVRRNVEGIRSLVRPSDFDDNE